MQKPVCAEAEAVLCSVCALTDREGVLNSSCRAPPEHSSNTVGTTVMSS